MVLCGIRYDTLSWTSNKLRFGLALHVFDGVIANDFQGVCFINVTEGRNFDPLPDRIHRLFCHPSDV